MSSSSSSSVSTTSVSSTRYTGLLSDKEVLAMGRMKKRVKVDLVAGTITDEKKKKFTEPSSLFAIPDVENPYDFPDFYNFITEVEKTEGLETARRAHQKCTEQFENLRRMTIQLTLADESGFGMRAVRNIDTGQVIVNVSSPQTDGFMETHKFVILTITVLAALALIFVAVYFKITYQSTIKVN